MAPGTRGRNSPPTYVAAFRRVAKAVHERSPGSAMIWAPNEGSGYPFTGGPFAAAPKSADGLILDTDGDGALTKADDPYAPYYPGDTAVDWIGVSLYHWGREYPWGENELPRSGAFEALIRGTVTGSHKDAIEIPDLYAVYAEGHHKPMAIVETAILYDPAAPAGGPTEAELKASWFAEVFASAIRQRVPADQDGQLVRVAQDRIRGRAGHRLATRGRPRPRPVAAGLGAQGLVAVRRRLTVLRRPMPRAAARPICGPRPPDPQAAPAPSIGRIAR